MYIYFLSLPSFWTLNIKRFWFLFSIAWRRKPANHLKGCRLFCDFMCWKEQKKIANKVLPRSHSEEITMNGTYSMTNIRTLNLFFERKWELWKIKRVKGVLVIIRALGTTPKKLHGGVPLWNINSGIELAALNSKNSVSLIIKDPPKRPWRRLIATWWWDWNFRYGHT